MKTNHPRGHLRPVLSQTQNNSTLWIGHSKVDTNDHFGGQTFACPGEGILDNIQVYADSVQQPGDVMLTLHEFDPASNTWGPAISQSHLDLHKEDDSQWVRFELEPVALHGNNTYGFRLQTQDAFIGLGEAATKAEKPFTFGCSWNGDTNNETGRFFKYFSLAFKLEMCA